MKRQKTISSECRLSGKGLFSGKESKVVFKPAPVDTGVVFIRVDLPEPVRIPAIADNISEKDRRTALMKGTAGVETAEHCLAAISALGINNILIEIDAQEMPGFDGSCDEYFKGLKKAGTVEQDGDCRNVVIKEPITIVEDDKSIYALPYDSDALHITFDMDYTEHTGVGRQVFSCKLDADFFSRELALCRTFVLEVEARQMQAAGIGLHLTPKEILVINSDGPIKNNFRYPDECVRHKIVDLIGDLVLAGRPVAGRIMVYKGGHHLNQRLARRLREIGRRADMKNEKGTAALLDIRRIQRILPHRFPFLMVDKVMEIEGDRWIKAVKNITINEPFFQGHFPGTPIFPGVLVVEAMAQVSGLLFAQTLEHTGKLAVLLTMDEVRLRHSVVPGDQLILTAEASKVRSKLARCDCKAFVSDEVVAEAQLKFMLVDDESV